MKTVLRQVRVRAADRRGTRKVEIEHGDAGEEDVPHAAVPAAAGVRRISRLIQDVQQPRVAHSPIRRGTGPERRIVSSVPFSGQAAAASADARERRGAAAGERCSIPCPSLRCRGRQSDRVGSRQLMVSDGSKSQLCCHGMFSLFFV